MVARVRSGALSLRGSKSLHFPDWAVGFSIAACRYIFGGLRNAEPGMRADYEGRRGPQKCEVRMYRRRRASFRMRGEGGGIRRRIWPRGETTDSNQSDPPWGDAAGWISLCFPGVGVAANREGAPFLGARVTWAGRYPYRNTYADTGVTRMTDRRFVSQIASARRSDGRGWRRLSRPGRDSGDVGEAGFVVAPRGGYMADRGTLAANRSAGDASMGGTSLRREASILGAIWRVTAGARRGGYPDEALLLPEKRGAVARGKWVADTALSSPPRNEPRRGDIRSAIPPRRGIVAAGRYFRPVGGTCA